MKSGANTRFELPFWQCGQLVAGVDEVGRGAVAGPVVAAAVVFDSNAVPEGLDDSKILSEKRRRELDTQIRRVALAVSVAAVEAADVDRMNILNATFVAMHRAIDTLPLQPDHLLVDGNRFQLHSIPSTCIVRGDATSVSIAAASIIAKTYRDALMRHTYHQTFPMYGFDRHVGYGTRHHLAMVQQHGLCELHRRSFLRRLLDT